MNKMLVFLSIVSAFMLSGCLYMSQGYTANDDVSKNIVGKKYDITFSVDYILDGGEPFGLASKENYSVWLKQYLQQSNAFSSVTYKPLAQKSDYHINFVVHYSYMNVKESVLIGYLLGYSLCTIPMWQTIYMDISAFLFVGNRIVYSPTTTEAMRCYIWIPFLPVGMVWNPWWALATQEKKCCRYLVNEMVNYQKSYIR